ncbi:MAG: hypothetical protein E6J71_18675 [Deltaproteobacteria bacterium]|nr:MAG: hypothetical protein E6J71_18675 [Deltaproteobacteria bacterium]
MTIRRMVTLRCALVLPLAASACFSGPLLPRLPAKELASIERPLGSPQAVHLQCVQSGTEFELRCQQAVAEVAKLLALSSWFTTLEASPEDASLVITIYAPLRRPYWSKPAHNPGFLLLSPVVPFWWSEPFGYRMSARLTASGAAVDINTTREGTSVMWGGAFLLNLSPNRSFLPHPERELHQILAQLLPLVGGPR